MTRGRCIAPCSIVSVDAGGARLLPARPGSRQAHHAVRPRTQWTPCDGAPSDPTTSGRRSTATSGSARPSRRSASTARFLPWNPPAAWAHSPSALARRAVRRRDGSLWMAWPRAARIRDNDFAWPRSPPTRTRLISIVEEDDEHLLLLVLGSASTASIGAPANRPSSTRDGLRAGTAAKLWQDRDATIRPARARCGKAPPAIASTMTIATPSPYSTEHTIVYKPRASRRSARIGLEGWRDRRIRARGGRHDLAARKRRGRSASRNTPDGRWLPPGPRSSADREAHSSTDTAVSGSPRWATDCAVSPILTPTSSPRRPRRPRRPRGAGESVEEHTEEFDSGDMLYVSFEDREGNL